MRLGPHVNSEWSNIDFAVDWKATPWAALEEANACLKQHGLEFIQHETGNDQYAFSLQPLKKD